MRRVVEYRRFADDCRKLARTLRKPEHRQWLQQMASAWEMLALEREDTKESATAKPQAPERRHTIKKMKGAAN